MSVSNMRTVAVDVPSGDSKLGIMPIIKGAVDAVCKLDDLRCVLVGPKDQIEAGLETLGLVSNDRIGILHTDTVVTMEDTVFEATHKKDSSTELCLQMIKSGDARGMVSSVNTGVYGARARRILGPISDDIKPMLLTHMPSLTGISVMADVGANKEGEPEDLLRFAEMAAIYTEQVLGTPPAVGLFNIGAEERTCTEFIKTTHRLLESKLACYGGLVEPDKFRLDALVNIGIGFCNKELKAYEGSAKYDIKRLQQRLEESGIAPDLAQTILGQFYNDVYPLKYAHAYFLGLLGIVIKTHGNCAYPEAFMYAILSAYKAAASGLVDLFKSQLL